MHIFFELSIFGRHRMMAKQRASSENKESRSGSDMYMCMCVCVFTKKNKYGMGINYEKICMADKADYSSKSMYVCLYVYIGHIV